MNNFITISLITILLIGCEQSQKPTVEIIQPSDFTNQIVELQQKIDKIDLLEKQFPNLIPVLENQKTIINGHIIAMKNSEVK